MPISKIERAGMPGGAVLQVVHADYNTPFTLINTSVNMVTLNLVHSAPNSKILVLAAGSFSTYTPNDGDQAQTAFYLLRDGSFIADTGQWTTGAFYTADVTSSYGTSFDTRQVSRNFLDSPNKAVGATTQYILRVSSGNAISYINRGSNNANTGTSGSYLTIMEIAA